MLKKRKFSAAVLLLVVYALLLCCEVAVNQVLCHKNDGSVDIEPAFLGFQCQCENDHSHPSHLEADKCEQLYTQLPCCYDLPLGDTWSKRNITHRAFGVELNHIIQYHLSIQIDLQLSDPFKRLPESVPLSKFLYKISSPKNSIVLRC